MLLYDKDLLSVQEVRELVERAKVAQLELAQKKQEDVDLIVKSIAEAGVRNAKRLAQLAHDETGFGIVADKEIKNIFGSKGVYDRIKDMKTIGVLKEDKEARTYAIAIPMGVIAGLIPSTNPTSTVFYKAEIAIK
ncbi:MAG: acetaldehyde dehydrogenase, partial [Anaerovorax sp.]|nr:acetaldehyde dehydrogenase [Anaerovorax sp.]